MKIKPVIIAGGTGTRLWPLSRQLYPKQFIKLFDGLSLLQQTVIRNQLFGTPSIIVGEEHRFIAAEQLREIDVKADLIIEPIAKNTAPCSIIAALLAEKDKLETVLLLPADHYISEEEKYVNILNQAINHVHTITTIGIKPTHAHTGYGYIKINESVAANVYQVEKFIEKPDREIAENYLKDGKYLWNSGIFIYNVKFFLEQAYIINETLFKHSQAALLNATRDLDFIRLNNDYYSLITPISIDYALMEHISNIVVIEASFLWNDLGNWNSLWEISKKNKDNNFLEGDIITEDVKNSYIMSSNKLTSVVGVSNIIIINTEDALLVANKSESEKVKHIVNKLLEKNRREAVEHTKIFRPWGYFQTIDMGDLYKVKKITVHPGQKLSLQYHHHRAEHWVVMKGIAEVNIGHDVKILLENDSIYIPKGMKHRITNIGEIDLKLIEVQTGHYLGEEDIVRLQDTYGRK